MKFTEQTKAINKAYITLRNIENDADLKKAKLTLLDYNAAIEVLKELTTPGTSTKTFIKPVAEFFKTCGFIVDLKGVNYIIST